MPRSYQVKPGILGGGGRHNQWWSDLRVDTEPRSQPVAFPRTNRPGRTPAADRGPTMTVSLAYVEVLPDEKAKTVVGFLRRAAGFYRSHGIAVEGLMTDNGPAYRSATHALACKAMGIKHIRTRPYRPQTNGKAERFIRTMLREWAYAAVYGSSPERAAALSGWLERYNYRRRHGALGHRPPIQRLRELNGNNVPGIYS